MSDEHFVGGNPPAEEAARILRTTPVVRERCGQLLARARRGESRWFEVDEASLGAAARAVADSTRERYPKLQVPLHSRWRHFEAGGVGRRAELERRLGDVPGPARAAALIDLTVISVLLDAGASADWRYVEPATGQAFSSSEGLAVASFHAFTSGMFSSDRNHPLQADAEGLRALLTDRLARALQVSPANPLPGLEGRAILLRRLGEAIQEQPEVFGDSQPRPAGLFDMIISPLGPDTPPTADVAAHDILSQILMCLSGIWPASNHIEGVPLGDCWRHEAVRGEGLSDGWVPLHRLSQWLTYSLLEPFAWGGVQVRGVEALTALPDDGNGGLMIDSGLLRLRDEAAAREPWQPGDELVVEWRALTVALMDEVAHEVRSLLRLDAGRLPLSCVLQGGSGAAGRALARRHRNGEPPLRVASDGMAF